MTTAGRGAKRTGFVLMVVGFVLAAASAAVLIIGVGSPLLSGLTGPVYTTPFTYQVALRHDHYLVMQNEGSVGVAGTLEPASVEVVDPNGQPVPTRESTGNYQINRNGEFFDEAVDFQAARAGTYQITVSGTAGQRLILARDAGSSFRRVAGWLFGLGGGGLCFLVGFVLLLVGFSRQRGPAAPVLVYYGQRQPYSNQPYPSQPYQQRHSGPGQPPPGWYPDPDPQQPGRSRYWDGHRWQP